MKAGSGLASAFEATPALAEQAVRQALAAAGLTRASRVILLLSREFARNPGPAVTAAARAAGCLQVDGCTASGLFTENVWQLDQPAAAALVIADQADAPATNAPLIAFSNHGSLPFGWQNATARYGLLDPNGACWAHGRPNSNGLSEIRLPDLHCCSLVAPGLRSLGEPVTADTVDGYELRQVGAQRAADALRRQLPPELREQPPLHQIALVRQADEPAISLLALNADGSLTLSAELPAGATFTWAIRQPLAAEQEMRQQLRAAAEQGNKPDFALMFSCIARGPLFYGSDDLDLQAFRAQFPGTPLLGAYGSGQIAPGRDGNCLFHNAAVTLLFANQHV